MRKKNKRHNGRKYDDPKDYKREYHQKMRKQKAEAKGWLIQEKGGKCTICGYKFDGKNHSAFDFHYRDSDSKEFNISRIPKNKFTKEVMMKEA